eukprot:SAG31_NODE_16464_length_708_cov_0.932677_1_plen_187_part_00
MYSSVVCWVHQSKIGSVTSRKSGPSIVAVRESGQIQSHALETSLTRSVHARKMLPLLEQVGTSPSIAVESLPEIGPVVALVMADAFCQNNEAQNKRPKPASCEQTQKSTVGVLAYGYARLVDWVYLVVGAAILVLSFCVSVLCCCLCHVRAFIYSKLSNEKANQTQRLNACDPRVMYGAYDQGHRR